MSKRSKLFLIAGIAMLVFGAFFIPKQTDAKVFRQPVCRVNPDYDCTDDTKTYSFHEVNSVPEM